MKNMSCHEATLKPPKGFDKFSTCHQQKAESKSDEEKPFASGPHFPLLLFFSHFHTLT